MNNTDIGITNLAHTPFKFKQESQYYDALKKWGIFLNYLHISWVYLPWMGADGNESADFFLPLQGEYIIISHKPGRNTSAVIRKYQKEKAPIVCGGINGKFFIEDDDVTPPRWTWLCRCNKCGNYFFLSCGGSYQCKICGEHEGDHHLGPSHSGNVSLFDIERFAVRQFGH